MLVGIIQATLFNVLWAIYCLCIAFSSYCRIKNEANKKDLIFIRSRLRFCYSLVAVYMGIAMLHFIQSNQLDRFIFLLNATIFVLSGLIIERIRRLALLCLTATS